MAPTIASRAFTDSAGQVQTFNMTKPAGVQVGDMLLLVVTSTDPSASNRQWRTLPGWLQAAYGDTPSGAAMGVYTRIADGTEGATVDGVGMRTSGFDREYSGYYMRVTGARAEQPLHAIGGPWSSSGVAAVLHTAPEVQTEFDDCLVLGFCSVLFGIGATLSIDTGPGWSLTDQQSNGNVIGFAEKTVGTAGLSGDVTFDINVSKSANVMQLAIAPAAADPPQFAEVASFTKANGPTAFVATLDIAKPAGVEVGDLLVVVFFVNGNHIFETPTGWSLGNQTIGNTDHPAIAMYWKIADGGEADPLTLTTSGFGSQKAAWYYRITGQLETDPVQGATRTSDTVTNSIVTNEITTKRLPDLGYSPGYVDKTDKLIIWAAAVKTTGALDAAPWNMDDGGGLYTIEDDIDFEAFSTFSMGAVIGFGTLHTKGQTGDLWVYPDAALPSINGRAGGLIAIASSNVVPTPTSNIPPGACNTLDAAGPQNTVAADVKTVVETNIDHTLDAVDPNNTIEEVC